MKPMLASPAPAVLRFPLLASPKIDGIRALVKDGVVLSRSLKPIPNKHVQTLFGRPEYEGFDGELVVGEPNDPNCMQHTTSGVMSRDGEPEVFLYVFDLWDMPDATYTQRYAALEDRFPYDIAPEELGLVLLFQQRITEQRVLDAYEADMLSQGYEGVMVRDPVSRYKYGRSTAKEGYLLKVKRFVDSEAEVIGVEELLKNTNDLTKDELGHAKRSTHKEGMVPMGTMGALLVRDLKTGVEFSLGGGFTAAQRAMIWLQRAAVPGHIVTYKHFPIGVVDKPRMPVFKSFRDRIDL